MFDLKKHQYFIKEFFFKHFKPFKKPSLTKLFVKRWLSLLSDYSQNSKFSCFDTLVPLIENLPTNPKALLVIPNKDTKPNYYLSNTTLFPLYPFRVYLTDGKVLYCKEGIELLRLYLEITQIKLVGFYRVNNYKFVMENLDVPKEVKFYTPILFVYFCRMIKELNGSIFKIQVPSRPPSKNANFG